jgi:regulator of protease activity HflC (stomatin/prohibitin superfamily)
MNIAPITFLLVLVFIVAVMFFLSRRNVPDHMRLAVFRLGRFVGVRGPGRVLLLPLLDQGVAIDLHSQTETISKIELLLYDRSTMRVDITYTFHVTDVAASVLEVGNPRDALRQLFVTKLQTTVASQTRGDVLIQQSALEMELVEQINAIASRWGVAVERVNIAIME